MVFYDYTKNHLKFVTKPLNYHLTLSYTGKNWKECENVLSKSFNVAVVFNVKKGLLLPTTFKGYPVIDGDRTDFRPNDPNGVIVGLRFKHIADKENERETLLSSFVVNPFSFDCVYENRNVVV